MSKEVFDAGSPRDERKEIECAMNERVFPDGSALSGHEYATQEEYDNCHVVVDRCVRCGHVSVGWWHMADPPKKLWPEAEDR